MTSSGNSLLSHPLSLRSGTHTRGRRRQRESPLSVHGRAQPRPPIGHSLLDLFFLEDTKDTCLFFFWKTQKTRVFLEDTKLFFWKTQKTRVFLEDTKLFFLEDTKDTCFFGTSKKKVFFWKTQKTPSVSVSHAH
jgi:hypothetical protein